MEIDIILEVDSTPGQVAELATMAEGYGIRGIWTQNYANGPDPFMSLMPAATATSRILLGAVVISPYEMHPLKIANAVSTLNEFSGGRGMVVIGGGGEWPGVMGKGYGKRVTGLREAIVMARRAVAGQVVKWDGEVYKARFFKSTWLKCKPPVIYAGATGPKMLAMATGVADGTMLSDMTVPMLPPTMKYLREGLAAHSRAPGDFRVSNFCAFHIKQDREVSFREARRELMIRGWLGEEWTDPFLTSEEARIVSDNKNAFLTAFRTRVGEIRGIDPGIVAKLVEGLSLAGDFSDLDRHAERLRWFTAAGINEHALRLHDDPAAAIRIIGQRLLPMLR